MDEIERFYDAMADNYHLIFDNWDASMRRQGDAIARLLPPPGKAGVVLDVACGIGTQSLALAALGYAVEGSDVAEAAVARARREAASRRLNCGFRVDDMRVLRTAAPAGYGAVIAMDNALPHLDGEDEIRVALAAMRTRLAPRGRLLLSVRDYAAHLADRTTSLPPVFYSDGGRRRLVFQVWDWIDERRYRVHLYITQDTAEGWTVHHFTGVYRAVTTDELARFAAEAGFRQIQVLAPGGTGFYQPIIAANGP